ncbi:hypothetical protein TeGR_g2442 [Tetraparma gracilis]|uniref:Uncharacterized protein n=1 Tax=Tetraparma gracilis TaxID=2962635 RepID=A0ABQ6MTN9_9STRA|nr:hypothetical protein TeGR_g2442 [Tetraparma gracilis]
MTPSRQQIIFSTIFTLFLLLVIILSLFGRSFLRKARLSAIRSSSSIPELKGRMRTEQVKLVARIGAYVFAVLPFVGFVVVYFLVAQAGQKRSLRLGIIFLPLLAVMALVLLALAVAMLRPSSGFWKTPAIRAVTSAYTRGHKDEISCCVVVPQPAGPPVLITSGKKDGKIKLWDSATGRLIRSVTGHARGVNHMSLNSSATKLHTCGVSETDGGEVREWDLSSMYMRKPVWTAFLSDVRDVTAVLGEKES